MLRELAASRGPQKGVPRADVAIAASRNFGRVFNSQMLWLESLEDLLQESGVGRPDPANQDTPARPPKELRDMLGDGSELA
jgi:hypothetical protein